MSTKATVGKLRQQCALSDADQPIVIVSDDPEIKALHLEVVEVFPDTTGPDGEWGSTFKVKVRRPGSDCGPDDS